MTRIDTYQPVDPYINLTWDVIGDPPGWDSIMKILITEVSIATRPSLQESSNSILNEIAYQPGSIIYNDKNTV